MGDTRKDGKRRLPLIQPGEPDDRPAWQWALIGAALGILLLFPLLALSQLLLEHETRRLAPGLTPEETAAAFRGLGAGARLWLQIAGIGAYLLPVAVAAFFGGFLAGRFGAGVGRREPTWAGLAVGAFVALIGAPMMFRAAEGAAWLAAAVLFVALATVTGRLGGRLGLRRAKRG